MTRFVSFGLTCREFYSLIRKTLYTDVVLFGYDNICKFLRCMAQRPDDADMVKRLVLVLPSRNRPSPGYKNSLFPWLDVRKISPEYQRFMRPFEIQRLSLPSCVRIDVLATSDAPPEVATAFNNLLSELDRPTAHQLELSDVIHLARRCHSLQKLTLNDMPYTDTIKDGDMPILKSYLQNPPPPDDDLETLLHDMAKYLSHLPPTVTTVEWIMKLPGQGQKTSVALEWRDSYSTRWGSTQVDITQDDDEWVFPGFHVSQNQAVQQDTQDATETSQDVDVASDEMPITSPDVDMAVETRPATPVPSPNTLPTIACPRRSPRLRLRRAGAVYRGEKAAVSGNKSNSRKTSKKKEGRKRAGKSRAVFDEV